MKKLLHLIGLTFLPHIINFYLKSLRINISGEPESTSNSIYIFWHSKMLLGWYIFRNKNYAAMVSQSKDGDILTNILKKWNFIIIRGSSSKGGKEALSEINSLVRSGKSAVITPDGPKGPPNEIKNGALIISNECDVPVIPLKIFYHKKKIFFKSWDKFELPLPFTKCDVHFGNKYYYKKYLDESGLKKHKESLSNEM